VEIGGDEGAVLGQPEDGAAGGDEGAGCGLGGGGVVVLAAELRLDRGKLGARPAGLFYLNLHWNLNLHFGSNPR
jgi:hypothetical protein